MDDIVADPIPGTVPPAPPTNSFQSTNSRSGVAVEYSTAETDDDHHLKDLFFFNQWRVWLVIRSFFIVPFVIASGFALYQEISRPCDNRLVSFIIVQAILHIIELVTITSLMYNLPIKRDHWSMDVLHRAKIAHGIHIFSYFITLSQSIMLIVAFYYIKNADSSCVLQGSSALYQTTFAILFTHIILFALASIFTLIFPCIFALCDFPENVKPLHPRIVDGLPSYSYGGNWTTSNDTNSSNSSQQAGVLFTAPQRLGNNDIPVTTRDAQCKVCLEEFAVGIQLKLLVCGHAFHDNCIREWFLVNGNCPACRGEVSAV